MRPADLKRRYSFQDRTILIEDSVFYLPEHYYEYDSFTFPQWSDSLLFGNQNPVAMEFCAGNGAWIEERARQQPNKNWVAVERRFDRIRKIWSKKKNHQINNLFLVCGEGAAFSTHFVTNASLSEIYINFPDPWPKNKHAKHRLMQAAFIEELARILVLGGTVTFVTDDLCYREQTARLFAKNRSFQLCKEERDPEGYGSSYFDSLWREKGRTIYYAQYCTK